MTVQYPISPLTGREQVGGATVLALYRRGNPVALRRALTPAWKFNFRDLMAAAEAERVQFHDLFRAAAYVVPADLPDPLPIWRGGIGRTHAELAAGLSWSTLRDYACWIASAPFFSALYGAPPLVIKATVPREWIIFYDPSGEIIFGRPVPSAVDGTPAEWTIAARRYDAGSFVPA